MDLKIRKSVLEDKEAFRQMFLQPDVLMFFPMYDLREIDDSIRIWETFCKKGASLTALVEDQPCGIAFLNLQFYKKFSHQCLITIIVDQHFRRKGIGSALMDKLFECAKNEFNLEMLHLEVYETNPAINLYQRLGFKRFGIQKKFIKEEGKYIGKIFMEREL